MWGLSSLRSLEDGWLHPCLFLSKKPSKTEQYFHIGNCELLAVKVALEE